MCVLESKKDDGDYIELYFLPIVKHDGQNMINLFLQAVYELCTIQSIN